VEKTSKGVGGARHLCPQCFLVGLAEEAGGAYKNIDDVIEAAELAGISKGLLGLLRLGTSRDNFMQIRTPLTVLTGPLGSGKTTLLRHILDTVPRKIAILMNEFGEMIVKSLPGKCPHG